MKFMQIHTFYPVYLESFYAKSPGFAQRSYQEQMHALVRDGFSAAHLFAPYLGACGYDSTLVVANCQPTQLRWLNENVADLGMSEITVFDAARMQVEKIKPDILYLSDSIAFDSRFVRSLSWKPKLILGWRAAVINDGTDWSEFDLMLSGLGALRRFALKLGARNAERFFPGYPVWANDLIGKVPVEHDVVFSGQWNPGQHGNRNEYLRQIARASRSHGFTASFNLLGNELPPEVAACSRGAVFGVDMHRALAAGRIVFDARATHVAKDPATGSMVDLSGKETANMRIIEATGCGRFLLTERFDNLSEYFELGREIETFSGPGELLEKINYYLRHPAEREEIARRGQERCLREYSMEMRAGELDRLIRKHLALKGAAAKAPVGDAASLKDQAATRSAREMLALIEASSGSPAEHSAFDPEFRQLLMLIRPYSMLGELRLYSLFQLAKYICENDIPGNFVECGVAAGGSSALLAYVIKAYSKRPRTLYSFDSFSGMPAPCEHNVEVGRGMGAEETGWGAGTCAAPVDSLLEIAQKLGVVSIVKPVKGYYENTLPRIHGFVGEVAFIHIDSDWYESTRTILQNFYDQIHPQAMIQFDDYGYWKGCGKALHEFEKERGLSFAINNIDGNGVWFRKTA
jgi:hypothetical protein